MQGPQEESVQRVEGEPRNEGSEVVKLKTEGGEKARVVGGKDTQRRHSNFQSSVLWWNKN